MKYTSSTNFLIISHEASLTGAPKVIFDLSLYIKQHLKHKTGMVFLSNGPLVNQWQDKSTVFTITEKAPNIYCRILHRIFKLKMSKKHIGFKDVAEFNADVIIFNSIASLTILPLFNEYHNAQLVLYIHEMPIAIERYFLLHSIDHNTIKSASFKKIFVVNYIIKEYLVERIMIPEDRVVVLPPCVNEIFFTEKSVNIKIKESDFIYKYDIVMCGYVGWTKGTDLLPQLILQLSKLNLKFPVRILWVGYVDPHYKMQIEYELTLLNVKDIFLEFTGIVENVREFVIQSKIFISLSRSDAMPTSCIEAMALGKPIICFRGSGGIESLVSDGCGFVVDYLDLANMSLCIQKLLTVYSVYLKYQKECMLRANEYRVRNIGDKLINYLFDTKD